MPHLIVREPGQIVITTPLSEGLTAGRHEDNDLVVSDHQVSRRHVQFTRSEGGWEARDLGSTHGTFVNGVKIERALVKADDRIQIGNVLITLSDDVPREIVHEVLTMPAPSSKAAERLRVFYEVSRAVGALEDRDELLGRMLTAVLDVFGCERAAAGLTGGAAGPLRQVIKTRDGAPPGDVVVTRGMLDGMLIKRQALILRGAASDTVVREGILSAMGAPLQAGERLFGFLYVDDRRREGRFSTDDLDFLSALAHLTAAALASAERYHKASVEASGASPGDDLVGKSPPMIRLKTSIQRYGASGSANVLIRGESGTGKELVARALHAASPRAGRPLVTINCAAIPETMIESELFGYERGAFTGATRDRKGKIALAHEGTLFLDEIGDLDLSAQAKVLRAIQEGEVQPLGSEKVQRVDVRFIAATHKDLTKEIAARAFREDLYYRLAVIEIETPKLSDRGEDIDALARLFLERSALGLGKVLTGFTPAALDALRAYPWPGNVRELRNEMERAAIHADSTAVDLADLSPRVRGGQPSLGPASRDLAARFAALEPMERALVEEALASARGNLSEAARLLGVTRIMMRRRVEKFGLKARDA